MPNETLPQVKTCSKCGETKPLGEFYRDSRAKDGRKSDCRDCRRSQVREWREQNPERYKARTKEWREANSERIAEVKREYYERNREKVLAASKDWDKQNPELRAEYDRRHYQRNKEKAEAHGLVARAIRSGRLTRPECCGRCGGPGEPESDGRARIHAHHHDYSKPLDVEWLCRACHMDTHYG